MKENENKEEYLSEIHPFCALLRLNFSGACCYIIGVTFSYHLFRTSKKRHNILPLSLGQA